MEEGGGPGRRRWGAGSREQGKHRRAQHKTAEILASGAAGGPAAAVA